MPHDFKRRMLEKRCDIRPPSRVKIIDTDHFMTGGNEPGTQVRAKETRSTCDKDSPTEQVHYCYSMVQALIAKRRNGKGWRF
jgi:hypothetical protein